MADSSHTGLWASLERHRPHRGTKYTVVHIGFWSTVVLLVLMLLVVLAPQVFAGWYVWIGLAYIVCQMAEFIARDPLNWSEVSEGPLFAVIPAIGGLLLAVANFTMLKSILTPFGLHVLHYWLFISWMSLIFGVLSAMRSRAAPYSRDETGTRGH